MSDRARMVAGIGASAGGLESLELFFRALPPDPGVAFIVVQHLSTEHKSLMEQIMGRFTALPVAMAQQGCEIRSNHVYLLPAGMELEVTPQGLALFQRDVQQALGFPIDRLLVSLADVHGPNAIGVILSGSGSDGSRGVRRIEAAGGAVFVEDPALAAFDGMPRAAIDAGAATAVMSAASLAQAVVDHARLGAPQGREVAAVEDIVQLLSDRLEADFGEYKRGTILRRALRRAQLRQTDLPSYARLLEEDTSELRELHDDLLIGVTAFFRDPEWFAALANEIQGHVSSAVEPARELRAWVAGCASGEEAYSIAILFDEAIRQTRSQRSFKVFATDVSAAALQRAGSGVYTRERLEHVGPQRLRQYFSERADGTYQVDPSLRSRVVFARHDLIADAPFTNLDLVSCRNLLIYFKPPAQRRALASLAYGLRLDGTLFLGSSESPGEMAPYFDVVNETGKIYRKRVHTKAMHRPELGASGSRRGQTAEASRPEFRLLALYDALLDRFMPPAFLVSEQRTLLDSYGGADGWLRVARRRPTGDFGELLPPLVRTVVMGALVRAHREAGPTAPVAVQWTKADGSEVPVALRCERIVLRQSESAYLVTLSVPMTADGGAFIAEPAEKAEHMLQLEHELADARSNLQATVEELEASNEELQATNEELMASNEELQSVNEELHSVNEELHTVNSEHQLKIGELTVLNRDIGHLLESLDVATIYLDLDLKIRKYTPRAGELFGLVEHDIGRYLASFNHQLQYPALMDDVKAVRDGGQRVEKEVRGRDDRWYLARLLSYRVDDSIQGVVVTFTDATALAAAREHARSLSAIVESTGDAIIGLSMEGAVVTWNAAATRMYGYRASEMLGQTIMRLVPEAERAATLDFLSQIAGGSDLINVSTQRVTKSGTVLDIAKTMSPLRDAEGRVVGIATIDRDIRDQKDTERRLRESEARFEDLYQNAPDLYLAIDLENDRVLEPNNTFLGCTGYARSELHGRKTHELFTPQVQDSVRRCLVELRHGRLVRDQPLRLCRKSAEPLEVTLSATAVFAPDGRAVGARVVLRDVSERRMAERKLSEAAYMREQFLAIVSHELRSPLQAINGALQVIDAPGVEHALKQRSELVVRRQTRQLVRLVDDLLDVSRIVHDKLQIERLPIDLVEVMRSSLDAVAPEFLAKGVKLVTEGFEAPLPMFGDAGRLGQVMANLLGNALRYTPSGRRVQVSCVRDGGLCDVVVADEGRGIRTEDLKSIFDMFVQARQGLARSEGGLGLGLTIAERIIAAHGGTLTARSEGEGRGAQFTVQLSLDPRAIDAGPAPAANSGKLSIVVVEDQEDARETMKTLLELEGHDVEAARDAEEGLAAVLRLRPQIGVFDIGLPGMNGYELAREVRRQVGRSITLFAMSGYGQPDDIVAAERAGFDRHLTKPVDPSRLTAALREVGSDDRR